MMVENLRLQRNWSLEQLAHNSGLSVLTIERIESGDQPSAESLKSLTVAFKVEIVESAFLANSSILTETKTDNENDLAIAYSNNSKLFYSHLNTYLGVMLVLCALNYVFSPKIFWVIWPALGWATALVSHAILVFKLLPFIIPTIEKREKTHSH